MAAVAEATFYVSPEGNDAWSGKLPAPNKQESDGPFATLVRARDAIREMKAEDVSVEVRNAELTRRPRSNDIHSATPGNHSVLGRHGPLGDTII